MRVLLRRKDIYDGTKRFDHGETRPSRTTCFQSCESPEGAHSWHPNKRYECISNARKYQKLWLIVHATLARI